MGVREHVRSRGFSNSAQEAMVSLLVAAGHVRRELAVVCEAHGVTQDQYNVLRILRGVHPAGYPRYEIAQRMIDRAPDVTRLLDRLERLGLVERSRSSEDRRLSLTTITGDGLKLLKQADPEILAVHERAAAGLTVRQRRELVRLCNAVLE
jgi:DNA-binding MarR family transcriptional regulator